MQGNLLASKANGVGGRIVNLADGRQTTLLRLLELLSQYLNKTIQPDFHPPRVGDVRESLADISLARKLLAYEPKTGLESGIQQTIEYYRSIA